MQRYRNCSLINSGKSLNQKRQALVKGFALNGKMISQQLQGSEIYIFIAESTNSELTVSTYRNRN